MNHEDQHKGDADGVIRAAMPVSIERAGDDDQKRRIRGYANTFGVMRSKRIIHPKAVEDWLKANPNAKPNLLAQHGQVSDFATIGRVDVLRVDRQKGLYFEAQLAEGTDLAEQAWALVQQGMLNSISIGWTSHQARWVRADDKDLDPWFARKMKDAGATEAYGFLGIELVEISVVDVADDPDAKLAAKAGAAFVETALAPLKTEIAALREEVQKLSSDGGVTEAAAMCRTLREQKAEFIQDLIDSVITALQTDDGLISAAQAFREDFGEDGVDGDASETTEDAGGELDDLRERVAEFGKKQ